MKLYWVTTDDHDEDWFIIASSAEEACKYHEDEEGYDPGDAKAEEVLDIPKNIPVEMGWPDSETLTALGGKFIRKKQPRVVEIAGRMFAEGMLDASINEVHDDFLEKAGLGRLNKTEKPPVN